MSFRQYGGINYAARNNIVKNNYSNANNLSVMTKVGQPASIINFESDISANIIYSDLTVNNLTVKYNTSITGPLDVSGNTTLKGPLDVSGNVGIGTTHSSSDALDVSGNTTLKGKLYVSNSETLAGVMYITDDITSPTATLRFISTYGNNYIESGYTSDSYSAADLHFTNMNDKNRWMTIKSDGKVGIGFGTVSPSYILDVSGNFRVNTDALINGLTVGRGSGNSSSNTAVGVDALKSNVYGINNTAIGNSALYSDVSGNYNTAVGFEALYNNLYSEGNTALGLKALRNNISGIENTAIGRRALYCYQTNDTYANGSGSYNVAVGNYSLYMNQSASRNVAVGHSALYSTNGTYNTAVGNNAMYKYNETWSGTGNTAVGNDAMYSNVSGLYCTAVGYKASYYQTGASNTSLGFHALFGSSGISDGDSNCAFGDSALKSNTTGDRNIAIGYHALELNTTAGENTAIGYLSLQNTTSGWNTAVGSHSLQVNGSGFYNTAVGGQALQYNSSGSNNTAVGLNAGYAINGSNDTAIGSQTLQYNSSGNNTAIGAYALQNSYGGNNNTAIGVCAGFYGTSNVICCTFLGSDTGATVSGLSGSTAIGYGSLISANNQIMMGRSTETVKIPGGLQLASYWLNVSDTTLDFSNTSTKTLPPFITFDGTSAGEVDVNIILPYPIDAKGSIVTIRRRTSNNSDCVIKVLDGTAYFGTWNTYGYQTAVRMGYNVMSCTLISDSGGTNVLDNYGRWYVIAWVSSTS